MSPRLAAVVPLLTVGLGLSVGLSGCGVTGTDFRPGVAAEVDGTVIQQTTVDDLVPGMCTFFGSLPQNPVDGRSIGDVRGDIAAVAVQRAAMEQLMEENDVEFGSDINSAESDIAANAEAYSGAAARSYEAIVGDLAYIQLGAGAVADALALPLPGDDGSGNDPRIIAGLGALADWIGDHDVAINPVYGLTTDGIDGAGIDPIFQVLELPALADTSVSASDGRSAVDPRYACA